MRTDAGKSQFRKMNASGQGPHRADQALLNALLLHMNALRRIGRCAIIALSDKPTERER